MEIDNEQMNGNAVARAGQRARVMDDLQDRQGFGKTFILGLVPAYMLAAMAIIGFDFWLEGAHRWQAVVVEVFTVLVIGVRWFQLWRCSKSDGLAGSTNGSAPIGGNAGATAQQGPEELEQSPPDFFEYGLGARFFFFVCVGIAITSVVLFVLNRLGPNVREFEVTASAVFALAVMGMMSELVLSRPYKPEGGNRTAP